MTFTDFSAQDLLNDLLYPTLSSANIGIAVCSCLGVSREGSSFTNDIFQFP